MTAQEIVDLLKEGGLSETAAQEVLRAAQNEKVAQKSVSWRQQNDYDQLVRQKQALEASYAQAKSYQDWYAQNENTIKDHAKKAALYNEIYGSTTGNSNAPASGSTTSGAGNAGLSAEEVKRLVSEEAKKSFNEVISPYSNRWSEILTSQAEILSRHLKNKRATDLNANAMTEIAKLAREKFNDNLVLAYEEWDKPEAVKAQAESQEAEIKRRVDEEMAKRASQQYFPAGAEGQTSSGGGLSKRSAADTKPYDRSELLRTFLSGQVN